jgi:hypothetical protein
MSESKYTTVTTHDGTKLIVQKPHSEARTSPMRLIDLLPDPKEVAREIANEGLDDRRVNDPWIRGNR